MPDSRRTRNGGHSRPSLGKIGVDLEKSPGAKADVGYNRDNVVSWK